MFNVRNRPKADIPMKTIKRRPYGRLFILLDEVPF